jgi:Flp pilus assembly protein TadD
MKRLLLALLATTLASRLPASDITPYTLIDTAIAEGRFAAAEEIIRRAPLEADDPELLIRVAELALAAGRTGEAMGGFLNLVDTSVTAARAWAGLGRIRLQRKDNSGAQEALDKALALDPGLTSARLARAILHDRSKNWRRAEADYTELLTLDPSNSLALANRGWSRLLRGQHAAAEADLMAALAALPEAAPSRPRIANNLRLARAMQGHYEQAFADSSRDRLAQDLNLVGFAAMARGDDDIAAAYFRRALELNPRHDKAAAANLAYLEALQKAPKP